jgi:DNA-binding transcriptional regulator YiaG
MPNVVSVLKEEILRLAKREAKADVAKAQQAASQYRREIAELKRLLARRDREIRQLKRAGHQPEEAPLAGTRFSAKSVKAQRQRLGLSAADYGKLVGVSGLTVYTWEQGKARPRKAQLAALVAVRGISKREALAKLAQ